MIPYIDIHAHHHQDSSQEVIQVLSLDGHGEKKPETLFTASIHPWSLPSSWTQAENFLKTSLMDPNCLGLGEVGLDKRCQTPWEEQLSFFTSAVTLLMELRPETLIVLHSVKSHQECLKILKDQKFKGPVVIHNYFGELNQTLALLKSYPRLYLSLGSLLYRPQAKLYSSLQELPLERLFFETDDSHDTPIESIYQTFCDLTSHDMIHVKKVCFENFNSVTKR